MRSYVDVVRFNMAEVVCEKEGVEVCIVTFRFTGMFEVDVIWSLGKDFFFAK